MLGLVTFSDAPLCSEDELEIIVTQTLTFTQDVRAGVQIILELIQSLLFEQTLDSEFLNNLEHNLNFNQTLDTQTIYTDERVQTLVLLQQLISNLVHTFEQTQTILFFQNHEVNNVYSFLLCQCIFFNQKLMNAIELSVTQTLTFEWIEREVLEQMLTFIQTIGVNWDEDACCMGLGIPDKSTDSDLVFTQEAIANMVYNIQVEQSLVFLNTAAWRP